MNRIKLFSMSVLGNLSAGIFVFTVPRVFAIDKTAMLAGAFTGVCMMGGYFMTAFLAGHASDRFGVRTTLTVGAGLSIAASLTALFATDLPTLYVAMGLLGAGNGIVFPATIAALTSSCRREETGKVLLGYTLSWNLGLMMGVPAAGWLFDADHGRYWAFGTALAAGIILLVLALGMDVQSVHEDEPKTGHESPTRLPIMAFAVLGWIGLFGAILSISHLQFLFPTVARQMAMPERSQSVMMVVHRALGLVVYLVLYYWNGWRFKGWPIIMGNLFGILGLWWLYTAPDTGAAFFAYVICAPFTSITYFAAITYAALAFPKAKKGMAGGINESIISAGFVLGPLMGGMIGDFSHDSRLPFAILAGLLLLITLGQTVALAVWARPRRKEVSR